MSNAVSVLVYSRKLGSPIRKAVMVYFAERASDNGEGIWSSKATMAAALECGRSTVIRTINEFLAEGLISITGKRPCRNGETTEYAINLDAVYALELVDKPARPTSPAAGLVPERDPYQSRSGTPTSPGAGPKPSLEPSLEPPTAREGPSFQSLWAKCPNRVSAKKAEKAFDALGPEDRQAALDGVEDWFRWFASKYPGAATPSPVTYLRDFRWRDLEFSSAPVKAGDDLLAFWAEKINGDGFVSRSAVSQELLLRLVEGGLVTRERLVERGF